MPIPSNIVLTPTSGVAPFEVTITGDNLFERPKYRGSETFLTTPRANVTFTGANIDATYKIITVEEARVPPHLTPVVFFSTVSTTLNGVNIVYMPTSNRAAYEVANNNIVPTRAYTYRLSPTSYGIVNTVTSGENDLLTFGSAWVTGNNTMSLAYYKKNSEGEFLFSRGDALTAGWLGNNPTREDSIIGKGSRITPASSTTVETGNKHVLFYNDSASATINTVSNGFNHVFGSRMQTTKQFFMSMWLKPTLNEVNKPYGIVHLAKSAYMGASGIIGYVPGGSGGLGTTAANNIDLVTLWKSAGNKFVVSINGTNTTRNQGRLKTIYVDMPLTPVAGTEGVNGEGAYEVGKWNHILIQYDGDPLGVPEIWVNKIQLQKSNYGIIKNDIIDDFFVQEDRFFYNSSYNNAQLWQTYQALGIVGLFSTTNPSSLTALSNTIPGNSPGTPTLTPSQTAFPGSICEFYFGGDYLTVNEILKYANLPKVELLKI